MQLEKVFTYAVPLAIAVLLTVVLLSVLKPSVTQIENQTGSVISSVIATTTAIVATSTSETAPISVAISAPLSHYIEIIDGCGPYYNTGTCVNARSGPGVEFPVVNKFRTGIVLRVLGTKAEALDGSWWYKVVQDRELRYVERVTADWYVAVNHDAVRSFDDIGDQRINIGEKASTTKRIVVKLSEEMLYAYDGDELFMKEPVSPGLMDTPTPRGNFNIYYKTPSRYMQGPIVGVSEQEYDLPGVPWNLYFTPEGAVIHGAYWHDNFGKKWSHGCVNMAPKSAEKLYNWAVVGMPVIVKD